MLLDNSWYSRTVAFLGTVVLLAPGPIWAFQNETVTKECSC
jgi:hypothetical protein